MRKTRRMRKTMRKTCRYNRRTRKGGVLPPPTGLIQIQQAAAKKAALEAEKAAAEKAALEAEKAAAKKAALEAEKAAAEKAAVNKAANQAAEKAAVNKAAEVKKIKKILTRKDFTLDEKEEKKEAKRINTKIEELIGQMNLDIYIQKKLEELKDLNTYILESLIVPIARMEEDIRRFNMYINLTETQSDDLTDLKGELDQYKTQKNKSMADYKQILEGIRE